MDRYENVKEFFWVQEEPANQVRPRSGSPSCLDKLAGIANLAPGDVSPVVRLVEGARRRTAGDLDEAFGLSSLSRTLEETSNSDEAFGSVLMLGVRGLPYFSHNRGYGCWSHHRLSEYAAEAASTHERITITRHGQLAAVLIRPMTRIHRGNAGGATQSWRQRGHS